MDRQQGCSRLHRLQRLQDQGHIAYGRAEAESAQDTEGMQTMRTLANNMAFMLKKFATGTAEVEAKEPWQPMNFVR